MKSSNYLTALILIFLAAACSDSLISPPGKEKPGSNPKTFGLVEVTITGIGTQAMSASVKPAPPGAGFAITPPGGSSGPNDGTIQMEPLMVGSFTSGTRGLGGQRYIYATFKVRNANKDENPYPNPLQNLTFLAVDNNQTLGTSSISELKLYDGMPVTGAAADIYITKTLPTGRVAQRATGPFVPIQADVLQVFTGAELFPVSLPPATGSFNYGFVTRSPNTTPGSRELPANPGANQFDGLVTFAFKTILKAQANQDPFEISFLFLPVEDSEERITQAPEFQRPDGNELTAKRFAELEAEYVNILPGASYRGASRLLCGPANVSGSVADPPVIPLFDEPFTFVSILPDPYAVSSNHIPLTTNFTATFSGNVSGANAVGTQHIAGFVVHARQTGTQYVGQNINGEGTPTLTTPNASFFANEMIEVSLTSQLNVCPRKTFRYRVDATSGNGSFTGPVKFNVGNGPVSTALGDLDGDGNMDIVTVNALTDDLTILLGDGTGSYTEPSNSPLAAGSVLIDVKLADVNNDGNLDIITVKSTSNEVDIFLGIGSAIFASPKPFSTGGLNAYGLALGDLNADGALDIVASNYVSNNVAVLIGDATGDFTLAANYMVGNGPYSLALGDVNNDGILDIVTGDYGGTTGTTVTLLVGVGDGKFGAATPFTVATGPTAVALGDLDNDGNLDIATTSPVSNNVSILLGDGLGGFGAANTFGPTANSRSIALGDLDNNGLLDIVTANASGGINLSVLLADGSGGFTATNTTTGEPALYASIGDVDNDGDLDIVIAEAPATTSIDQVAVLKGQ